MRIAVGAHDVIRAVWGHGARVRAALRCRARACVRAGLKRGIRAITQTSFDLVTNNGFREVHGG